MKNHINPLNKTSQLSNQPSRLAVLLLCGTQLFPVNLFAAPFTIVNGQVETNAQSLIGNETGTINSGGQLNFAGDAIVADGTNNTITNAGSISTTTDSADGIVTSGTSTNTSITNSGSIVTNGTNNANGILSQGANDNITSSGSISTTGTNSRGIRSTGDSVSITHSGTITTQADASYGIVSSNTGTNATINHSGTITTTGTQSDGIRTLAANASITSSGTINTSNLNSRGIRTTGSNTTIMQHGSIITSGQNGYGIISTSSANVTNTGKISTSGNSGHGIYLNGDDINVTNSGSISVSGTNAVGVNMNGLNGTLTNSGSIIARGSATAAISGSGNNDTVTINTGSRISGSIDLGTGTDTVNINGHNPYQTLSFSNVETINTAATYAIKNANTVTTIEPTRFVAESNSMGDFNSAIQSVLHQHTNSLRTQKEQAGKNNTMWTSVFTSESSYKKSTELLGRQYKLQGIVFGFEKNYSTDTAGYIAGYAKGESDVLTSSLYKDNTSQDSFFAGIYNTRNITTYWDLHMGLMLGAQSHTAHRKIEDNLNGFETANAEYLSINIAPAISLAGNYQTGTNWLFRPGLRAEAIYTQFDAYTETGTSSSNLDVAKRATSTISLRADLEAVYLFNNRKSEVSLSLGYDTRINKSDRIAVSLGNSQLQFELPGEKNNNRTYIGSQASHQIKNGIKLLGSIDVGTGESEFLFAMFGIHIKL